MFDSLQIAHGRFLAERAVTDPAAPSAGEQRDAMKIPGNMLPAHRVDTDMDLFDELVHFETDVWNAIERRLLAHGLVGLATLQALRAIGGHAGHARVFEVGQELRITVGAASKLVDRLVRDGFAERLAHPTDRRSSLLVLTDAGTRAREQAETLALSVLDVVFADADAAAQLAGAVGRLRSTFAALEAADA